MSLFNPLLPDWIGKSKAETVANPDIVNDTASGRTVADRTIRERQLNVAAAGAFVPIAFGPVQTGGEIFWADFRGSTLYLAIAWCIGEVESVEVVTRDGEALPAYVSVTNYTGSTAQGVDPTMAALRIGWNRNCVASVPNLDGTTNDVGLCYSVLAIGQAGEDEEQLIDAVKANIQGLKQYDPRTGLTSYTENAWLHLNTLLTSKIFGAGRTADWSDTYGISWADDIMPDDTPRHHCGILLDSRRDVQQWVETFRTNAMAFIDYQGADFVLTPNKSKSHTREITDEDIQSGSFSWKMKGYSQRPNACVVQYTKKDVINNSDGYAEARWAGTLSGVISPAYSNITLTGISNYSQAMRHAYYRVLRSLYSTVEGSYITRDTGLKDRVGDVVLLQTSEGETCSLAVLITSIDRLTDIGRYRISWEKYDRRIYFWEDTGFIEGPNGYQGTTITRDEAEQLAPIGTADYGEFEMEIDLANMLPNDYEACVSGCASDCYHSPTSILPDGDAFAVDHGNTPTTRIEFGKDVFSGYLNGTAVIKQSIKLAAFPSGSAAALIGNNKTTGTRGTWTLVLTPSGKIGIFINQSAIFFSRVYSAFSVDSVSIGEWLNIELTVISSSATGEGSYTIKINNIEFLSDTLQAGTYFGATDAMLRSSGSGGETGGSFDGLCTNISISSPVGNLIADFSAGAGETLPDLSGGGNTGTIVDYTTLEDVWVGDAPGAEIIQPSIFATTKIDLGAEISGWVQADPGPALVGFQGANYDIDDFVFGENAQLRGLLWSSNSPTVKGPNRLIRSFQVKANELSQILPLWTRFCGRYIYLLLIADLNLGYRWISPTCSGYTPVFRIKTDNQTFGVTLLTDVNGEVTATPLACPQINRISVQILDVIGHTYDVDVTAGVITVTVYDSIGALAEAVSVRLEYDCGAIGSYAPSLDFSDERNSQYL